MTTDLPNGQESPLSESQVLTLGAKQSSWRMIECSIPHRLCSNSHVCIDGVVYFVVKTGADLSQRSLVKFDLRYEKLDFVTSLPADMPCLRGCCSFINYEGKVAIPTRASGNTFNVWVIDQAAPKHGWLKLSFSTESWNILSMLRIYGFTHTGEFVLAPKYYSGHFNVILYNTNTKGLRKIKVDVKGDYEFMHGRRTKAVVFSEYIESICKRDSFHSLR
ncbi:unnamed protein product [Eruca vesicaria subsp. sativa]|uniref:F-box associated beta-propeller type 3 domain-containing protein n=1 Tax=Eruca vesicaria subsp. sativa TaxID=29727 RepID=A0ABC8LUR2_ERUVS|nr:unnamed protein product [Eruca vesicaria subsp. sativa]